VALAAAASAPPADESVIEASAASHDIERRPGDASSPARAPPPGESTAAVPAAAPGARAGDAGDASATDGRAVEAPLEPPLEPAAGGAGASSVDDDASLTFARLRRNVGNDAGDAPGTRAPPDAPARPLIPAVC